MPEAAFNLWGIKWTTAQSPIKLLLWGYLQGSERLERSYAQPWCNILQRHRQSGAKVWRVAKLAPKPWHGHSWPGTGPGATFPACWTSSHNHHWWRHLTEVVCGLLFMQSWECSHFKTPSFISSLQLFQSKFSMFSFPSSCIYGLLLVEGVLLFQKTEMRNYLSQLILGHLNIFKYLALQSESFSAFLFHSLQPAMDKEKCMFLAFATSLDLGST